MNRTFSCSQESLQVTRDASSASEAFSRAHFLVAEVIHIHLYWFTHQQEYQYNRLSSSILLHAVYSYHSHKWELFSFRNNGTNCSILVNYRTLIRMLLNSFCIPFPSSYLYFQSPAPFGWLLIQLISHIRNNPTSFFYIWYWQPTHLAPRHCSCFIVP